MEFKDYYKILEITPEASQDDIRKAYRKLARKYHPDVSKEKDAETRMREVNEANDVLRDEIVDYANRARRGLDAPTGESGHGVIEAIALAISASEHISRRHKKIVKEEFEGVHAAVADGGNGAAGELAARLG